MHRPKVLQLWNTLGWTMGFDRKKWGIEKTCDGYLIELESTGFINDQMRASGNDVNTEEIRVAFVAGCHDGEIDYYSDAFRGGRYELCDADLPDVLTRRWKE